MMIPSAFICSSYACASSASSNRRLISPGHALPLVIRSANPNDSQRICPCAAAAAECDDPVKMGLVQALGVLIDTVVICSCTAFLMLLVPQEITAGLTGMNLLQTAMQYHLGSFGIVFIAVILALFSFSTFLGVLYYARGNVAYLCGDNWWSQTAYKLLALAMLLVGGTQAYTVVWDLGDVGIGLMTIFNMLALIPLSGEALTALNDYEKRKKIK